MALELEPTSRFHFSPSKNAGLKHAKNVTEESSRMLERVLEENHVNHHIFTTTEDHKGVYFHNHIAHHDITIWALGASPETIRSQHDRNSLYQRGPMEIQTTLVEDMAEPTVFKRCLGREENFLNFCLFFEKEIDRIGYQAVFQKYLVGGTEMADDILCRIYMGYVHGIIHIGMALEFKQARLLAEGFAQACVHHDWWYTDYLTAAEKLSKQQVEPPLPLSACVDLARANEKIRNCSSPYYHMQKRKVTGEMCLDLEPARDGVLKNAGPELIRVAARYRVDPNDLDRATAELQNTAVYLTAGAQRPPFICAFDFFLLHSVTSSIGHTMFLAEPSLTREQKARLLEYTGRVYLMSYAGQGCPEIRLDWLASHPSRLPNQGWDEVFDRACYHEDDGHMCKLIRCMAHAQDTSKPYDHLPEFRVKQSLFLTAGIAAIDSGSSQPMDGTKHFDFVRGAGFEEAWQRFPKRDDHSAERARL
ncbi:Oxidoreductase AflY [Penicillium rolfsii]|nr:Oxidoreductase AflY [Penicillium rolfsii]